MGKFRGALYLFYEAVQKSLVQHHQIEDQSVAATVSGARFSLFDRQPSGKLIEIVYDYSGLHQVV